MTTDTGHRPSIFLLSEETINKIAAGEVVEGPTSVIKELFENSVDAGSSDIEIEIIGGGLGTIRISDDGKGMNPIDAVASIQRHTTSKIKNAEDLEKLTTMGFRGEALASIASISIFDMKTAEEGSIGTHLQVEGGLLLPLKPCARSRGTTITIQNLFYNVPARKKFQKSASQLRIDIQRVVEMLALAHPHIGVRLLSSGTLLFEGKQGDTLKQRANRILGEACLSGSFTVEAKTKGMFLEGYIGHPTNHRKNRLGQYVVINNRPISSKAVSCGVKEGYGTHIPTGAHPIFILHLKIDPDLIDVNVHPQKKEVRFQDEWAVQRWIERVIAEKLGGGTFDLPIDAKTFFEPPVHIEPLFERKKEEQHLSFLPESSISIPHALGLYRQYLLFDGRQWSLKSLEKLGIKNGQGLIFIDLSLACQKIAFDKMIEGKASTQLLLLPINFSVTSHEDKIIEEYQKEIEAVGFSLRLFGHHLYLVESIPSHLKEEDWESSLREVLAELSIGREKEEVRKKIAKKLVNRALCKTWSVSVGQMVIQELMEKQGLLLSPKGKPIAIEVEEYAIRELFKD